MGIVPQLVLVVRHLFRCVESLIKDWSRWLELRGWINLKRARRVESRRVTSTRGKGI